MIYYIYRILNPIYSFIKDFIMSDETRVQEELEEQVEHAPEVTELEALAGERDEWKDKCLRLAADFENFKKRTAKERIQWQQLITGKVLKDVIALVDDVDRARKAQADPAQAVEVLHKQLISLLQSYNVTEMQEVSHFDPTFHEAVAHVPSEEHESGDVIEVLQKGYFIGTDVLRPAKVAVAQ